MSDILSRIRQLLELYQTGHIPRLAQHEVHPELPLGSRENYLYFTLPVCINFQRSSPAMWASALATWNDPETRYLFLPENVCATPVEKVRADLMRHKLGLQPNKHTAIWLAIAGSLHKNFADDPREVITAAHSDAGQLIHLLQVERRKDFPYLSGPKLSNYWPYILSQYTDVTFTNTHEISIIPDTHVIQCTIHLGLAPASATSVQVEAVWREVLEGSGISPVTMHPVLWNWSRNNFLPEV
jgi:hypothetical protein